jgi:CDP-glycerol glycerophosphotransferase (TagB/SpsB family)
MERVNFWLRIKFNLFGSFMLHLLLWPLYYFIGFFPRRRNIWVFGNGTGYNGNSKYLFEYITKNEPRIKAYWIAQTKSEFLAFKNTARVLYKYSLSCWVISSFSKIRFSCISNDDVNFWTGKSSIRVQLWHGIPIKKISRDNKVGLEKKIFHSNLNFFEKYYKYYEWLIKPNFIISPSEYVTTYSFKSAFEIDSELILNLGNPRVDYILNSNYKSLNNKNVIYMPTFRNSGMNFINDIKQELSIAISICNKHNYNFFIKLHPYTDEKLLDWVILNFPTIKILENKIDIYDTLNEFSILITDYSSIVFDFAVLNRPILMYQHDYQDYITKDREHYFETKQIDFLNISRSKEDFIRDVRNLFIRPDKFAYSKECIRKFHEVLDGSSSEKITNYFMKLLELK